jgi:hypothetical protein
MDPTFGPYLDILPRDFDEHPLTWCIRRDVDPASSALWVILPPDVKSALDELAITFSKDWSAVQAALVSK